MALLPRVVVVSVMRLMVVVKIVRISIIATLVRGRAWLEVFVVEVELSLVPLSHLVGIVELLLHGMSEFSPVWHISKMRTFDPALCMAIHLCSVRSSKPLLVDASVMHWQIMLFRCETWESLNNWINMDPFMVWLFNKDLVNFLMRSSE